VVRSVAGGAGGQLWLNRAFGPDWQGWIPIGGQTVLPAEITPDRKVLAVDSVTANPYYRFVN
jgi:hypothetical protein